MSKRLSHNTLMREADEAIFTALIKKGAHDYLENDMEGYDQTVQHNCTLSQTCEHKIKSIILSGIRKEKRRRSLRRLSKLASVFLIIIVFFAVTSLNVEAMRVKLLNLMICPCGAIIDITVKDNDNPAKMGSNIEGAPTYIPSGYQFSAMDQIENKRTLLYTDNKNNEIRVKIYDIGYQISIDTHDAECGNININGNDGFYSIKNNFGMLVFQTVNHAYLIIGKVGITELQKIAESI